MAYTQPTAEQCAALEQEHFNECRAAGMTEKQIIRSRSKFRKARWAEHMDATTVRPEIARWATAMAASYGPKVRCHDAKLDWPTALMVVRYGEAEYHWPLEFSDEDVERAGQIKAGKWGEALEPIGADDDD